MAGSSGPFKFLDYYEDRPEDIRTFAGREADVRELVAKIISTRTVILYGRSGLGKTSVLNAGVFPALRDKGFLPIYARIYNQPRADLQQAITEMAAAKEITGDDIKSILTAMAKRYALVLVLDQFEEFFIRFRTQAETRKAFTALLAELLNHKESGLHIIFSLREDYLANMDDFYQFIPEIGDSCYRLLPFDAFEARQAIISLFRGASVAYHPDLIRKLLQILDQVHYDTTFLQIVCTQLYRNRPQGETDHMLVPADLEEIGGLDGVFEKFIDETLDLYQGETLVIRLILDTLITLERTKKAVPKNYFFEAQFMARRAEIERALDFLNQHRLVRRENKDGRPWYELIHDRMVDSVLKWLSADVRFFRYREAREQILIADKSEDWDHKTERLLEKGKMETMVYPFREWLPLSQNQKIMLLYSTVFHMANRDCFEYLHADIDKESDSTTTKEVLLGLMNHANPQMCLGAVRAAKWLPRDPRIAAACLKKALTEEKSDPRRFAGQALKVHLGEQQIDDLKHALVSKDKKQKRYARETLADLSETQRKNFRFMDQQRAAREHAR